MAGDFDGDGIDDVTFWRTGAGGTAAFFYLRSSDQTVDQSVFGQTGDDPRVIYDYDGDGRTDVAVFRLGTAAVPQSMWFYRGSSNNPNGNITFISWGGSSDFANPGDIDGDGRGDFCNQRNFGGTSGGFWCLRADGTSSAVQFGLSSDFAAPGDYDGDGKVEHTVVRTQSGQRVWYIPRSSNGTVEIVGWGVSANGGRAQGDYDGDGRTDVGIWQAVSAATTGSPMAFWARQSTNGAALYTEWGIVGDTFVNGYNVR
jgi:hypothetical protein